MARFDAGFADDRPLEPDDVLETKLSFGKYKGATWEQVLDRDPSYVEWAIDNVDHLTSAEKEVLSDLLPSYEEQYYADQDNDSYGYDPLDEWD